MLVTNANDDNATTTLYALLKGLDAKVTRATIQNELAMHPDFPSLLSMSDVLTYWKIDNTALQLNTVEQLRELPMPFIAHLKKNNGWYVQVTELTGNRITYTDSSEGRKTQTVNEFEKSWSGVVLLAEANEQSGEADYARNRPKGIRQSLRGPFLLAGSLLVAFIVILSGAGSWLQKVLITDWFLLFTKMVGLTLSCLLVAKQLGGKNTLTDRLCQLNSKTNCDSVLNSPGAKLWGWLSWADVGLLYFAGSLVTALLLDVQPTVRPLLHWLALLALPYTIYSVYYQARVVEQWCTLCLAVQVVLLAEGILALTQLTTLPGLWQPYTVLVTAYMLPILTWVLIKPLLTNATIGRIEHNELQGFKRNPEVFYSLLMQQPKMPPVPDNLHPISLGNPEAEHTITMVTNPFCGPCAKTHTIVEQLLNRNSKANIIFACDGVNGRATQVAIHILALTGQIKKVNALSDWYGQSQKNYDVWVKRHPVEMSDNDWTVITDRHRNWCIHAGITGTPTLYVDGYKLPMAYNLEDIRWILGELKLASTVSTGTI